MHSSPVPALTRPFYSAGLGLLSDDVKGFLFTIGKDSASDHEVIRDIYYLVGRALWETTVAVRLELNGGTAKALVGLMLNVT